MPRVRSSRLFLVGLGLLLALIGGSFCYWMGQSYLRIKAVDAWPAVPCMILKSEVVEFFPVPNVAPRYRLDVDYFYQFDGRSWHSGRVRSRVRTTTDRARR